MSPTSLRREIGGLLIAGFQGTQLPIELKTIAHEFGLGGIILFAPNIVDPEQIAELCHEALRLVPDLPLWVSVDQEGGRVARLKSPFTEWPPMRTLGRSGRAALAEEFGRALGVELRAIGINLDFAPVLDIHTNPQNPVIGDRALSDKADEVARLGAAIIRALQAQGVAACGKHFPGHGDTSTDSHQELPIVEHPPDRLEQVEWVPFKAAIEAEVASIMTAHVLLPALDDKWPATLSKRVITGILREQLGYDGIVFSDDLDMKAIADRYAVPSAAVMAVGAGCDGLLICQSGPEIQVAALEALIYAVEQQRLPRPRVTDALARQRRAKERFLASPVGSRPPTAKSLRQILGSDRHRSIAEEMAQFL